MATQLGTTKKVASADTTITAPAFETFTVTQGMTSITLAHTPIDVDDNDYDGVQYIYALNGDSTLGTKYTKASAASSTEFAINAKVITIPTGLKVGTQLYVMYEYAATSAVEVVNSATEFPSGCKFVMEVLGCDVCDQTTKIYAYIVFPNAKLSPDFDWSVQTDGTHPFSMTAQQDYCDAQKKLFSIIVPEV